jgi:hypothetical protein
MDFIVLDELGYLPFAQSGFVVENSDPPDQIRSIAHIETFTGRADVGRFGLFPAA